MNDDHVTTLAGVMDQLMLLARGDVAAAVKDATGATPKVTRYQPRQPNGPAIWHERRSSPTNEPDTEFVRDTLNLAVIFAVHHSDGDAEAIPLEAMLDRARVIYDTESKKSRPLGGVHYARRAFLEPPTPTWIDGVPLLTSGIVLQIRIEHRVIRVR